VTSLREKLLLSAGPGQFAGVTTGDWLSILRENRFRVDPPYLLRAAIISVNSAANSMIRRYEELVYGAKVRSVRVMPPIFILGHWRSGTTHLHNLFTTDQRLSFPNLFQAVFPHIFLSTEPIAARLLRPLIPNKRLGDNVRQHIGMAFEDEFALCAATGLSPYMSSAFPRRQDYYDRYLTFRGVSDEEIARWKSALLLFLQKLTWKNQRPIVLKSPTHTCRIRLLLDLFPDARFIHIHRNPYAVFVSSRRRHDAAIGYSRLQRSCTTDDEMFIRRYREMYDVFFAERQMIPPTQYHELAFEDLEKDPVGELRQIYARLGLPEFAEIENSLAQLVRSQSGYKRNDYVDIPGPLRSKIGSAWQRNFEEWGYAPSTSPF
jgi:omega-hydroxy-beta-dihydromenaquinone-9 sulfotransferase